MATIFNHEKIGFKEEREYITETSIGRMVMVDFQSVIQALMQYEAIY
jgi:hypothetical protein